MDRTAEAPIIRTTRRVFGKKAAVVTAGVIATGVATKTGVLHAVSEEVRRGIEQALDSPMGKPVNYDPVTKKFYFVDNEQEHQIVEIELVLGDKSHIEAFKEPYQKKKLLHHDTFRPTPGRVYYAKRFAGATYVGTTGLIEIGEDSVGIYYALVNRYNDFVDPQGYVLPEGQRLQILGNHVNPIEDKLSGETAEQPIPTPQLPITSAGAISDRPVK